MEKIPANTLKEILELRSQNGLDATKEALEADLAKSKAKWTLEETPRYRRAGRSPLYVSGKHLTAVGVCPASGEKDENAAKKPTTRAGAAGHAKGNGRGSGVIDETAFYKVLHGKGFEVEITQNLLTGEQKTKLPASINKLGLKFSAIPANATDIHVIQTTQQIQVAMPLDKFLEIAGVKP